MAADFVLVIASQRCRAVGDVNDDHIKGPQAEMALMREELTGKRTRARNKYLSVVLPGGSLDGLPVILQPRSGQHFIVKSYTVAGAESLIRALTGQRLHVPPAVRR